MVALKKVAKLLMFRGVNREFIGELGFGVDVIGPKRRHREISRQHVRTRKRPRQGAMTTTVSGESPDAGEAETVGNSS